MWFKKPFVHLALTLLCSASSCFATVKSGGIGLSGTAYPTEANSSTYNPANSAFMEDRWDVDGGAFIYSGKTKIYNDPIPGQNGTRTNSQAKMLPVGSFGINKWLTNEIVVNLATDGIRSFKGKYTKGFPRLGQGKFEKEYVIPILAPGCAWRFHCQHAIGISFPIYTPRIKINGLQNIAFNSIHPHHVSNKGYDWAYGLGVRLGYYWQAAENLSFGVLIKPKLLAASHFKKYQGLIPKHGLFEDPFQFRIGVHYAWNCWNFSFDFEGYLYSKARTLHNSANSTALAGSRKGPGLGWPDQYTIKTGLEYQWNQYLTLRAGGIFFVPVLVKKSNFTTNLAGETFLQSEIITAGATYRWRCLDFSVCYGQVLPNSLKTRSNFIFGGGYAKLQHSYGLLLFGVGSSF